MALTQLSDALARYAGRRVLVTGDTGFKGAWLAYWLHELGAEVHGFALPPVHDNDLYRELGLDTLVRHVDGDVRDLDALVSATASAAPEVVFHLAAQSLVKPSYDDPVGTFATNVQGTVHLLEAVRRTPSVRSVVVVTSDKCYRNREWTWGYRESDELGGHDPYSASKAAAEVVAAAYRDSFFAAAGEVGLATVRAGNVIGGGDESDARIVPDCIRALRARAPIVLRRPAARRPWQHVLEPLAGYLSIGQRLVEDPRRFAGAWNFGPRAESVQTVRDVTERIISRWGEPVPIELGDADFHETHALRLSIDKATAELGWEPRWDFDKTLDETVAWYRAAASGADMRAFTSAQIAAYGAREGAP